jgi:hypothetical protein
MSMQQEQEGIAPNAKGERVGTHLVTEMKMKRRLCVIFRLRWYSPTSSYSLPPFIFVSRFLLFIVISFDWPPLRSSASFSFPISCAE